MESFPCKNPMAHNVEILSREKAALNGITQVIAFDDTQLVLMSEQGEITLTGQNMHVTKLMLEEGQMTVEGRIDGLFYTDVREKRKRRRNMA